MDDAAELLALRIEDVDSARAAGIDVACRIHFHAVRVAGLAAAEIGEEPLGLLCERAVGQHVKRPDLATPGVDDVEHALIRGEREPVRPDKKPARRTAVRTGRFYAAGISLWDRTHRGSAACCSAIPGLHDSLAYNLPALKFEHRRTKHLGPIGVRAALREGEAVAYGNTIFDLVRHVASADILKIGRDSALAFQIARLAGRIVTINNQNDGIVGMKAGKREGLAPLDRTLEPGDGYGTSLGLGLGFGDLDGTGQDLDNKFVIFWTMSKDIYTVYIWDK